MIKMKNKDRKNKDWKKLFVENWLICHEIIDLRDGHKCQIPECQKTALDLDHGISRDHKSIFFDVRHLGYLCRGERGHHPSKSFNKNGRVAKEVDLIHIKREGIEIWEELLFRSRKTCPEFSTVFHQEQINIKLKETRAEYLLRI